MEREINSIASNFRKIKFYVYLSNIKKKKICFNQISITSDVYVLSLLYVSMLHEKYRKNDIYN